MIAYKYSDFDTARLAEPEATGSDKNIRLGASGLQPEADSDRHDSESLRPSRRVPDSDKAT